MTLKIYKEKKVSSVLASAISPDVGLKKTNGMEGEGLSPEEGVSCPEAERGTALPDVAGGGGAKACGLHTASTESKKGATTSRAQTAVI